MKFINKKTVLIFTLLTFNAFSKNNSELGFGIYTTLRDGLSTQFDPNQNFLESFSDPKISQFGFEAYWANFFGLFSVSSTLNFLSAEEEVIDTRNGVLAKNLSYSSYSLMIPIHADIYRINWNDHKKESGGFIWNVFGGYSFNWISGANKYNDEDGILIESTYSRIFPIGYTFGTGFGVRIEEYGFGIEGSFSGFGTHSNLEVEVPKTMDSDGKVEVNSDSFGFLTVKLYFRYFIQLL